MQQPQTNHTSHVPGKVFTQVLLSRIELLAFYLWNAVHRSSLGLPRVVLVLQIEDAILALRLLSEVHREFNRPLYARYVDLKSAFDSVDPRALWKAVRGVGA